MKPSTPIRDYLDTLVHPSVRDDALLATRHRVFIATRLFAGLIALGILPIWLAVRGVPTPMEFVMLAWMIIPIATACYLSRSGRFKTAHVLSALALTIVVTVMAANSGGLGSFAAVWLVLIPLEAAVMASRRVVAISATSALVAAGLLLFTGSYFATPPAAASGPLVALGVVAMTLYAAGIGVGAALIRQTLSRQLGVEQDRYRLVAAHMRDVVTHHGPNGRVLFASPNALAVLGAAAGDLQGHGLFDRIHIADRPAFLTAVSDTAADGKIRTVEFRIRRTVTEGRVETVHFAWIEMCCRRFEPGSPAAGGRHVVAVMRDVSRQRAEQDMLLATRAEAERAEAAKNRFLAIMSHELRTPLNAIIGFSEMLENEAAVRLDAARRQEYAQLIKESGHHLLAVVNDVLDVSRLETGEFEIAAAPFDLAAVLTSCRDLLGHRAQDGGVTLACEVDALPTMVGDKRAVRQILINLIANAIKFTDRGGTVRVAARRDGAQVVLSVEDNGIGIAPDDLARIGKPFFQAQGGYARRHEGTGLGVSIVKGLVKLHGGVLDIRSRLGEGTRVVVRLPLDVERAQAAQHATVVERVDTLRRVEPRAAEGKYADVLEPAVKRSA